MGGLFLSPSGVYVRSFLYIFYTLIKLYYTKSSERSRLVSGPRLNSSPLEAKNPGIFRGSATTFHFGDPGLHINLPRNGLSHCGIMLQQPKKLIYYYLVHTSLRRLHQNYN